MEINVVFLQNKCFIVSSISLFYTKNYKTFLFFNENFHTLLQKHFLNCKHVYTKNYITCRLLLIRLKQVTLTC